MGKIVELIESKDKNIRLAKFLIGKAKIVVTRPIHCLCPLEFSEEFHSAVQNEVKINELTKTKKNSSLEKKMFFNRDRGSVEKVTCHDI